MPNNNRGVSDFQNALDTIITTSIPMMIVSGRLNFVSIICVILPVAIMFLVQHVFQFLKNRANNAKWKNYKFIELIKPDSDKETTQNENVYYNYITEWIVENYTVQYRIETSARFSDNDKQFNIPRYILLDTGGDAITLQYENNEMFLSAFSHNEKGIILRLYGETYKLIQQFLCFVSNEIVASRERSCNCKILVEDKYSMNAFNWSGCTLAINKTFENLYLDESVENAIKQNIDAYHNIEPIAKKMGIPRKRGVILYGKPGTGKSATAYAIAKELGFILYILNTAELCNTKSKNISTIVNTVKSKLQTIPSKSVVLIDDIDLINATNDRDQLDKENQSSALLRMFLDVLDGYIFMQNTFIVFTTNNIEKIEPALIRPGRIDDKICYPLLTHYQIRKIMRHVFDIYVTDSELSDIAEEKISSADFIQNYVVKNLDKPERVIAELRTATKSDEASSETTEEIEEIEEITKKETIHVDSQDPIN